MEFEYLWSISYGNHQIAGGNHCRDSELPIQRLRPSWAEQNPAIGRKPS